MFKREMPYADYPLLRVAALVAQNELKPIPQSDWPSVIQRLIEDCCRFNPTERIQSFEEILKRFVGIERTSSSSYFQTLVDQRRGTDQSKDKIMQIETVYS